MITIGLIRINGFDFNSNVEIKSITTNMASFSYTINFVHKFISAN